MKVWLLFDYNDFVGVYATEEAALKAVPGGRAAARFRVSEYEVQR